MRFLALACILFVAPGLLFSGAESQANGYIGVGVMAVGEDLAHEIGWTEPKGALVVWVQKGWPAAEAGLKLNDIILALNDTAISDYSELGPHVSKMPPGEKVRLKVFRDGKFLHLTVRVVAAPSPPRLQPFARIDIPQPDSLVSDMPRPALCWRNTMIGIEYEGVEAQLAEFFGVKEGALIRWVRPGSPAQEAGLKAGDVVVKIKDKPVTGAREMVWAFENRRVERTLPIAIVRDHKQRDLKLKLGTE